MNCLQCDCDLGAVIGRRCPECGRAFDRSDPKTFRLHSDVDRIGRPGLFVMGTGCSFVTLLFPIVGRTAQPMPVFLILFKVGRSTCAGAWNDFPREWFVAFGCYVLFLLLAVASCLKPTRLARVVYFGGYPVGIAGFVLLAFPFGLAIQVPLVLVSCVPALSMVITYLVVGLFALKTSNNGNMP